LTRLAVPGETTKERVWREWDHGGGQHAKLRRGVLAGKPGNNGMRESSEGLESTALSLFSNYLK
jgi:hypothetical protein